MDQNGSTLIIEDELSVNTLLYSLGYEVDSELDGDEGLRLALDSGYQIVLLNVMSSKLNGFQVLSSLRSKKLIPVLILTAKDGEKDCIKDFKTGTDDYLGKPFSMEDLKLRIASTLRCAKTDMHHDKVNINHISRVINSANLNISMNKKNGEVLVRNQNVKLTPIEFDLLYALIKEQGEVLSKARLYQSVLLREFSRYDRTLDMHISKIRKKITAAGIEVNSIKTVRGQGYCFDE
ncbi:response regulator transcription factor [Pseudomonas sp. HK3]